MNMADVFAVFGTLLALGIALPGMLLTWRLLWPNLVDRAQQRIGQTPWACFALGMFLLGFYLVPVLILFNVPLPGAQLMGFIALFLLMAAASVGGAGLAALLAHRLQAAGVHTSAAGATIRGAVALELAAIFPVIGWFVFIPLAFVMSLGATAFALLRWVPRQTSKATLPAAAPRPEPANLGVEVG